MTNNYKHYIYRGQVDGSFGKILETDWYGETIAPTKRRALSNLMYRFREEYDLFPRTYISLDPRKLHIDEKRTIDILLPEQAQKKEEPSCQQLTLPLL